MKAVADLKSAEPYAVGCFGILYGVGEINATTVKTFFKPLPKNINSAFIRIYENLKLKRINLSNINIKHIH
jgi:hypothetical protein